MEYVDVEATETGSYCYEVSIQIPELSELQEFKSLVNWILFMAPGSPPSHGFPSLLSLAVAHSSWVCPNASSLKLRSCFSSKSVLGTAQIFHGVCSISNFPNLTPASKPKATPMHKSASIQLVRVAEICNYPFACSKSEMPCFLVEPAARPSCSCGASKLYLRHRMFSSSSKANSPVYFGNHGKEKKLLHWQWSYVMEMEESGHLKSQ